MSRPSESRSPALWVLWALFLLVPLVFSRSMHESFRLPKLLLAESLALASLVVLGWRLRRVERVDWRAFFSQPVVRAVLPVLAAASLGLLTSDHPLHVREGLASLWIGGACLVGWSLALSGREHRLLLRGLILPATALAVLAVLQFHGVFRPFRFEDPVSDRIGMTSLAGGAFDLAAYLALPCLIAQVAWRGAPAARLWGWVAAGSVCVYALLLTQTLTAFAAFAAGSFVLWLVLSPRRRGAAVAAVALLVATALALGVEPLRDRLERKLGISQRGDLNRALSGRLDGWRAALWMLRSEPLTGVGHGAYRAEYGLAKRALAAEGRRFSPRRDQAYFVNAHSELLEVLAEWGLLGAAALASGLRVLWRTLRRLLAAVPRSGGTRSGGTRSGGTRSGRTRPDLARSDLALMCGALVTLALLTVANFPLRIALTAYPAILLLSWIFAAEREAAA